MKNFFYLDFPSLFEESQDIHLFLPSKHKPKEFQGPFKQVHYY